MLTSNWKCLVRVSVELFASCDRVLISHHVIHTVLRTRKFGGQQKASNRAHQIEDAVHLIHSMEIVELRKLF